MAVSGEALDIILRLQGVPTYIAGMREAAAANKEFAASQARVKTASNEAAASSEKAGGAALAMSKGAKAGGLLIAAALVEGYKGAVNFNKQMEMIATQAGGTQKEVDALSKSVLAFAESGRTKFTSIQLAEGLYHLESIGLRGPAAMKALEIASNGAAVGNANLEHTTTALGAAWIVGAKGAGNLHSVMGILNATVGAGNMRMEQLVQALGSGIIPISRVAHLSIQDIGAAAATLTDSGFTASSGMAQLGTALHFLYDPSTKAKKALESIGLSQRELFQEMEGPKGLHGALELLHKHLQNVGGSAEQAEKLGEILPGGRGKVMITLLEELERFEMKKQQILARAPEFDDKVKKTMETPAFKISAAWSKFNAVLIEVGDDIKGPFTEALVFILGALGDFLKFIISITNHGKLLAPIILAMAGAWVLYKAAMIGKAALDGTAAGIIAVRDSMILLRAQLIALAIYEGFKTFVSAIVAGDSTIVASNVAAGRSFLALLGPIALAGAAAYGFIKLMEKVTGGHVTELFGGNQPGEKMREGNEGAVHGQPYILSAHAHAHAHKVLMKSAEEATRREYERKYHHKPPGFAEGGYMPFGGFASINERGPGETVWLPKGAMVTPSPATSLLEPRAHTPTPTPNSPPQQILIDAYLQLPRGISSSLFKLITQEAVVKEARS